jgi:AcrR family transcriptional regulator
MFDTIVSNRCLKHLFDEETGMNAADDTRTRLLDTAGAIFADKGFRATTVREISDKAGVNLAAINYHFGDKEQLYVECVRHAGTCCATRVPLPQWEKGIPGSQKLRDFVQMFLNRAVVDQQPPWHSELIMRELGRPSKACATFVQEFVRPTFGLLNVVLEELLGPAVPLAKRRLIAFSIVGQCLHYRFTREVVRSLLGPEEFAALDIELLTDHITQFSLAAIERLRKGKTRES